MPADYATRRTVTRVPPHRWSTRQRIGSVEIRAAIDADIQATPCVEVNTTGYPTLFRIITYPFELIVEVRDANTLATD